MTEHLSEIRQRIDAIDRDLVSLLEERMTLVEQVIAYKKEHQLPVLDQQREDAVLQKVANLVQEERYREALIATFSDIMTQSRRYQEGRLDNDK